MFIFAKRMIAFVNVAYFLAFSCSISQIEWTKSIINVCLPHLHASLSQIE
jgi:hypothetical protein